MAVCYLLARSVCVNVLPQGVESCVLTICTGTVLHYYLSPQNHDTWDVFPMGMLSTFPQCNFSMEFPEILRQNHMLLLVKIMHCGILINLPY